MEQIIETACSCGEPISVELNNKGGCRKDGKRPFYPDASLPEGVDPERYSMSNSTRFRCRACSGWLGDTVPEAALDDDNNI